MPVSNTWTGAICMLAAVLTIAGSGMAQPSRMNYQGELLKNGARFDGVASIKAAIISSGATLWSNDGTSANGSEPTAGFAVSVTDGLLSFRLGDASLGMNTLVADALVAAGTDVALRVWVDTGDGFEQLSDQSLSSSAFALQSDAARRAIGDFTISGKLGIGTLTPQTTLDVNGIVQMSGLKLTGSTSSGWVLTSDAGGVGTWQPASSTSSDNDWTIAGSDMYSGVSGDVGIGTQSPRGKLDVAGAAYLEGLIMESTGNTVVDLSVDGSLQGGVLQLRGPGGSANPGVGLFGASYFGNGGGLVSLYNSAGSPTVFHWGELNGGGAATLYNTNGNNTVQVLGQGAGIGGEIKVFDSVGGNHVSMGGHNGTIETRNNSGTVTLRVLGEGYANTAKLTMYDPTSTPSMEMIAANREIRMLDTNGGVTVQILGDDGNGNGRVKTNVLEITGGADLSESFDITTTRGSIEPGLVVCIDPRNPGKLVMSDAPYQRTVAGIVSGAGGVRPGMLMSQHGSIADGEHPVALTGRVWAWCDASGGAIEPGDLLTTSAVPGHAMKVLDHQRAHGAVLGKAMTAVREGTGLVLVLVSLQ